LAADDCVKEGPMALSPDAFARTWFEDVWNKGDEQAIDRLMARDAVFHGLGAADEVGLSGIEAFKPFYRMFREAIPDLHIDVVQTITEGDRVAVHCHVTGRHTGAGLGIAASDAAVDFWGMCFARVRDGRIEEGWNVFDFLSMHHQVGLVQSTVSA
jgi:steroid delta-isomerase-like uncharacterized protein